MTLRQYNNYLSKINEDGLLSNIYNGWRILEDLPPIENVTLDLVLKDKAFIKWNKEILETEYTCGI